MIETKGQLHAIEVRKSKEGKPAIQLVVKTDLGDYLREWINVSAPNFVWERWGSALGITGEAESVKTFLTQVGTSYEVIGTECRVLTYVDNYNGRDYTKIKDAKHLTDPSDFNSDGESKTQPESKVSVLDDEIPF